MKNIIYLLFVLSSSWSMAQTGYLQVFSSGGNQKSNTSMVLQGTIGEAVMYSTGGNYTQGFQQAIYKYTCDTLAQLTNNLDTTICLNDVYALELKHKSLKTIEWWSKTNSTILSQDIIHSYQTDQAVKDSVFAIVKEGLCTDTSDVIGLEVIAFDTAFVLTDSILCKEETQELSTNDEYNIAWFLDNQEVGNQNQYTANLGGTYHFTKSYKHCLGESKKQQIRLIDFADEKAMDDILTCSTDTTLTLLSSIPTITWTYLKDNSSKQGLTYQLSKAGDYLITYEDKKCTQKDTFNYSNFEAQNLSIQSAGTNLCASNSALSLSLSTTQNYDYQWYWNDKKIQGANTTTYNAIISGKYSLKVANTKCATTINPIDITSTLSDLKIQENGNLLEPSNFGNTHQWYVTIEGKPYAIVGATNASYKPLYNGTYQVNVNAGICKGISSTYDISKNELSDVQRYVSFNENGEAILIEKATITLYPNPSLGIFTIYHSDKVSEKTIKIYDVLGNVVLTKQTTDASIEINLTHEVKGFYWIEVQTAFDNFTQKIVIE